MDVCVLFLEKYRLLLTSWVGVVVIEDKLFAAIVAGMYCCFCVWCAADDCRWTAIECFLRCFLVEGDVDVYLGRVGGVTGKTVYTEAAWKCPSWHVEDEEVIWIGILGQYRGISSSECFPGSNKRVSVYLLLSCLQTKWNYIFIILIFYFLFEAYSFTLLICKLLYG